LCGENLEDSDELTVHLRRPHSTDLTPPELQLPRTSDRYDTAAAAELEIRSKYGGNPEEKWSRAYKIIFPEVHEDDIPSMCKNLIVGFVVDH
jgi:hypothetical protein